MTLLPFTVFLKPKSMTLKLTIIIIRKVYIIFTMEKQNKTEQQTTTAKNSTWHLEIL